MRFHVEDELWGLMEDKYRQFGASSNAAQLTLRQKALSNMVNEYGVDKVRQLLTNDFPSYHVLAVEILKK